MHTSLPHKRVYVFDWDGTLFDSMGIKTENFCEVLLAELTDRATDGRDGIRALFQTLSGIPRYTIFQRIAEHYGVALSPEAIARMSAQLTQLNTTRLAEALLFPDVLPFLTQLAATHATLYISSSVPTPELRSIVEGKLPKALLACFSGIYGSEPNFTKGKAHISRILTESGMSAERCIVFGDDEADVELSKQAGVDCLRLKRSGAAEDSEIASFAEVLAWLK